MQKNHTILTASRLLALAVIGRITANYGQLPGIIIIKNNWLYGSVEGSNPPLSAS